MLHIPVHAIGLISVDATFWGVVLPLIIGITLYASWKIILESKNLTKEKQLLEGWKVKVRTLDSDELERQLDELEALGTKPVANIGFVTRALYGDSIRDGLVVQALRAVWSARKSDVDLEAISTMLSQREEGRLSFPSAAPNLLMLCGLGGTVLGLAETVPKLAEQIEQAASMADPKLLGASLSATLTNMQAAFYATLAGVITALCVGFGTRHVASMQSEFLADVQEFIVAEFGPRVLPQNKEATVEDLAKALKEIKSAIKQVPAIMSAAAEEFGSALEETGNQMRETLGGLQSVSTEIQDSLKSAAGDVKGSALRLAEATEAITSASTGLEAYHRDLTSSQQKMLELYDQSRTELELQIGSQLSSITEFKDAVIRSTAEIVSKISDSTTEFRNAGQGFQTASEEGASRVVQFRESVIQGFGELQNDVQRVFSEHESGLGKVSSELRELSGKFDPVVMDQEWKSIRSLIQELNSGVSALATAMREFRIDDLIRSTQSLASHSLSTQPIRSDGQSTFINEGDRVLAGELKSTIVDLRQSVAALTIAAQTIASQTGRPPANLSPVNQVSVRPTAVNNTVPSAKLNGGFRSKFAAVVGKFKIGRKNK